MSKTTGQRVRILNRHYNNWTVIGAVGSRALVRCKCGKLYWKRRDHLLTNRGNRCSSCPVQHPKLRGVWHGMRTRCTNPRVKEYAYYGARGIKVCERWSKFSNFYEDMGSTYSPGLQLDRINNDGDYKPSNCRWVNKIVQANNTRKNHRLTYEGRSLTISQWGREVGLSGLVIYKRLKRGWSIEKTLTTPLIINGGK